MPADDREPIDDPATVGKRIGDTDHDNLSAQDVETVNRLLRDVAEALDADEYADSAETLLAFWDGYLECKLEVDSEWDVAVAESRIDRFEQAFDEGLLGVDLYEALETLAIVSDIPDESGDSERVRGWTRRVLKLTSDFQTHLEGHTE